MNAVQNELTTMLGAVDQARDNAVHEQSKPENQYDTLALEAAYLAHGQSVRAAELQRQITVLKHFESVDFKCDSAVAVGAVVHLREHSNQLSQWLWVVPVAGGVELQFEEINVTTITSDAPLGRKVLGCYEGDEILLRLGSNEKCFEVVSVI
ncbi:hypothetical protein [Neptunomonas japonica]|uniref:hypothetical protein n=1 Tax=Neptunomonas japonica TaxID=417574 RepID=UPI00191645F5|nr:hypothetical protein [Neptunomonas japonica]